MVLGVTPADEAALTRSQGAISETEQPKSILKIEERLQIIHLAKTHKMPLKEIARLENKMLSTVRSVVLNFKKHGRINKLLTLSAKKLIMEKRAHRLGLLRSTSPRCKHICKTPKIHLLFGDNNK